MHVMWKSHMIIAMSSPHWTMLINVKSKPHQTTFTIKTVSRLT